MIKKLKCAIIDDEAFAIKLLEEQLALIPNLSIHKIFTNPIKALVEISQEDEIDILFLDIDMPELSGIDLAAKLVGKVRFIIFTTAYSQYALEAFGVYAFDYLLKPIEPIKLIDSVNRVLQNYRQPQQYSLSKNIFFIKGEFKGKYIGIKSDDIILFYTKEHYIMIETTTGQYRTNESLRHIEEKLVNDERFIRVHQSNIINMEKIQHVDGNTIYLSNKWKVPVSDFYKKKFMELLSKNLLNPR
ncbi:LytR/AlgR family response regulator transcription factor [Pedobacter sp. WC2501]|uniref:LytR/AlgR family response regulator transcription factor n=1 Tax=Pedobacter sp. WC2501 TaxID=3461400 RepID=UPI004045D87B